MKIYNNMNLLYIRLVALLFFVLASFFLINKVQIARADYGTYLKESSIVWEGSRLHATWSPSDNDGGSDCNDAYSGWSCGCFCVDEGQEQALHPYIILNKDGAKWDERWWPAVVWHTGSESWDVTEGPYNDFYWDLPSMVDGNYTAQLCFWFENRTDTDEHKTFCPASTVSFIPGPICTPNWQCESPANGYEKDGCGNRRVNSRCDACVPSCPASNTICVGSNVSDSCGGICPATKTSSWRCESAWNGYAYDVNGCANRTRDYNVGLDCLNNNPTGSLGSVSTCGNFRVYHNDSDRPNIARRVYLRVTAPNGSRFNTPIRTLSNGATYSYDARSYYTASRGYGVYDVDLYVEDLRPDGSYAGFDGFSSNSWRYTLNDPANCDSCNDNYSVYIDGEFVPVGQASENELGYVDTSGGNIINLSLRLKDWMQERGGSGNIRVVSSSDKVELNTSSRCNACRTTYESNTYSVDVDKRCAIPDSIVLDPESIDFDYSDDGNSPTGFDTADAVVGCSLTNEKVDITTSAVLIDEGELDACFNVSFLSNNFPYKRYQIIDNLLASRCDGAVNFDIDDYVYGGESWGPLNGKLNLIYQPNEERVSERFEYSGDVIVNPPPGFEQFYFPEF